ncbi:MAG: hypothetical protein GY714_24355 [Desulfobacterales bacterium]|nr:hypothetical protein [Desulfobacterales bacterium]
MSNRSFIEKQKFRQRLFHIGQILNQKQPKWIEAGLNCCMNFNNAGFAPFGLV